MNNTSRYADISASIKMVKNLESTNKPLELRAITYCYIQDNVQENKVVGIFYREQLEDAFGDIKEFYKRYDESTITEYKYDESCDNYYLEYSNGDYFYSSNYTIGKLNL